MVLQSLKGRDATDVIKAEIQTAQAGAEQPGQIRHLDGAREMQGEIARCIMHHLPGIAAAGWSKAIGLLLNSTRRKGRVNSSGHVVETRDTDHARSPGFTLHDEPKPAPRERSEMAHTASNRDAP